MSICNRILGLSSVCSYGLGVAFRYADFVHGILNGCLVCILCKFRPGVSPVVCCIQLYRFAAVLSICFQLYGDACCSQSILVVIVFPDFSYTHGCLFRCVSIGNGCDFSVYAGVCQAVAFRHVTFTPAVSDVGSIGFFGKICDFCTPVIVCCQSDFCSGCFSICKKVDIQALWSLSILIVVVIPDFLNFCFCSLLCIAISNYKSVCCTSSYFCCITIYRIFTYRIYDFSSIFILWKIFKTICPALICCYNLACYFCSICKKSHCNAIWSLSILVVIIVPYFSTTYSYFIWISTIGYCNIGITINTYCFKSTLM